MLILDTEQTNEAPALDRLLRSWWARFQTWLRGDSPIEAQADNDTNEHDCSGSLIL